MRLRADQSWFTHAVFGHIALAFALSYVIGFERELRGSAAGDRTFALVGTGAAAVTAVAANNSPQAIAGVLTGIGFIGAGLVFRGGQGMLKGITSAATIFAVTAIGVVAGYGKGWLAVWVTLLVLIDLELRHIPFLNVLDARRYARDDDDNMMP